VVLFLLSPLLVMAAGLILLGETVYDSEGEVVNHD
jgi:hypothetical protein